MFSNTSTTDPQGGKHIQVKENRFQHTRRQNIFYPLKANQHNCNGSVVCDPEYDGKCLRKSGMRTTVDYNAAIIKMLEARVWQRDYRDRRSLQPYGLYIPTLLPPSSYEDNPINAVTTRFVKTAMNKIHCPIFCAAWTPEGRRLVTGGSSGEFTLWNGLTFNFETRLQAHGNPVRAMVWSHNDMWMVTADHAGYVKYWQSTMNNLKMFMAHQEAIRGISFSPSDIKFASCSDDGTIKIWDFYTCQEESILRGHGADVKCIHWHPQKGLIISGSKDNQQPVKLWDPKTGTSLATIHAHKSTVMDIKWNNNGNWFVTASRDHLLKLFDLRNISKEIQVFRGHKKESSSVAWHPIHEGLLCSGGSDGAILFWQVGAEKEVGAVDNAHDSIVWTLAWHPMGHLLCSGSNDHTSKFWTRNRPGDTMRDWYKIDARPAISGLEEKETEDAVIPGLGPEDKVEINSSTMLSCLTDTTPSLEDIDIIIDNKNKTQSKKVPYSKPIPMNFQINWYETEKLDDLGKKEESRTVRESFVNPSYVSKWNEIGVIGMNSVDSSSKLDGQNSSHLQQQQDVPPSFNMGSGEGIDCQLQPSVFTSGPPLLPQSQQNVIGPMPPLVSYTLANYSSSTTKTEPATIQSTSPAPHNTS